MAGSMSRADLLTDLKASLADAAGRFTAPDDADFTRHLTAAAADMHRIRPRTLVGEITLQANVGEYAAPVDILRFKSALWGIQPDWSKPKPWEKTWPGTLPRCRLIDGDMLSMAPAPSAHQIALLGTAYRFYYVGKDVIGETEDATTIHPKDRNLLMIRAQAEAMQELAMADSVRPVQIGGGFGQQAKTGTPQALWSSLMTAWLLMGKS